MRGENNQNLGKTLPVNESRMTKARFFEFLKESARLDPQNFKLGNVAIEGDTGREYWPVIVGEHAMKRRDERTYMIEDEVLAKCLAVLFNPVVVTEVIKHRIIWDDDEQTIVDFDDGIMATTVKLEGEGLVLVFEAGLSHVRLKTLWTGDVRKFSAYDSAVININKYGAITFSDQEKN